MRVDDTQSPIQSNRSPTFSLVKLKKTDMLQLKPSHILLDQMWIWDCGGHHGGCCNA